MSRIAQRFERGYSLLEALIVLGLVAVITLLTIPMFLDLINNYRVATSASEVAINLRFARNASIKQQKSFTVKLALDTDPVVRDYYTISGGIIRDRVNYLTEKVKFNSTSTTSFTFKPNGSASSGTITIKDPRGQDAYKIEVRSTGAVVLTDLDL